MSIVMGQSVDTLLKSYFEQFMMSYDNRQQVQHFAHWIESQNGDLTGYQIRSRIKESLSDVDSFPVYNIPGPVTKFIDSMRDLSN